MACIVVLLGSAVLEVSKLVDKYFCVNIIPLIDERLEGKRGRVRKWGEMGGGAPAGFRRGCSREVFLRK